MPDALKPAQRTRPRTAPVRARQWIRVANSAIHGKGVYARVAIPDGTHVVQYRGERITKAEARRREDLRLARERRGGDGCVYIFQINKRHDLDGRTRGNEAKWINHSCTPNCRPENIGGKIWIIARRDIPAGAELSFDYGYAYDQWRLHPCRCGTSRCVGFIVNAPQRWLVRRALRGERNRLRQAREK